jgi:uncharacterized damage-inducible protein DinB
MPRANNSQQPVIRALLRALEQAYDHSAWHGTNLRGSVRGLTAARALWRPAPGRHNIYEEVLHAAYWKYAVRRNLLGEKRGAFPIKGSNWFAAPNSAAEKDWKQAVALMDLEHKALCAAVESFPAARLRRPMKGTKWLPLDRILGIALHDVYHAGQIQMLKRLQK